MRLSSFHVYAGVFFLPVLILTTTIVCVAYPITPICDILLSTHVKTLLGGGFTPLTAGESHYCLEQGRELSGSEF